MTDAAPTDTPTAAAQIATSPPTVQPVVPAPSDPVEGAPMVDETAPADAPSSPVGSGESPAPATGAGEGQTVDTPSPAPAGDVPSTGGDQGVPPPPEGFVDTPVEPVTEPTGEPAPVLPSGRPSDTRELAAMEAAGIRSAISATIAPHLSALEHLAASAERILADIHSAIATLRDQHPS